MSAMEYNVYQTWIIFLYYKMKKSEKNNSFNYVCFWNHRFSMGRLLSKNSRFFYQMVLSLQFIYLEAFF